jgi:hypothetical protein
MSQQPRTSVASGLLQMFNRNIGTLMKRGSWNPIPECHHWSVKCLDGWLEVHFSSAPLHAKCGLAMSKITGVAQQLIYSRDNVCGEKCKN